MTAFATHRLNGLEHDNLLAFLALLGLLRTIETAQQEWHPRVFWTVDDPPLRPALRIPYGVSRDAIAELACEGLNNLAKLHNFDRKKLEFSPSEATSTLQCAANSANDYSADLWAALISDAAVLSKSKDKEEHVEPTPLCFMSGQGRQYFLDRLTLVPQRKINPKRAAMSETGCLYEALFDSWKRPDKKTGAFRWDPNEDVRHAYRARDPNDQETKEKTQHGANRLAAIGISVLTVAPTSRNGKTMLTMLGGHRGPRTDFYFQWPIWQEPTSLAGIRALLSHPDLESPETRNALGIVEILQAKRISAGKFMNVTRALPKFNP